MARAIIVAFLLLLIPASQAKLDLVAPQHIDSYMEGAMKVYKKFSYPSKQESERFYNFMKGAYTQCFSNTDCEQAGIMIAKKYAEKNNVEVGQDEV